MKYYDKGVVFSCGLPFVLATSYESRRMPFSIVNGSFVHTSTSTVGGSPSSSTASPSFLFFTWVGVVSGTCSFQACRNILAHVLSSSSGSYPVNSKDVVDECKRGWMMVLVDT